MDHVVIVLDYYFGFRVEVNLITLEFFKKNIKETNSKYWKKKNNLNYLITKQLSVFSTNQGKMCAFKV